MIHDLYSKVCWLGRACIPAIVCMGLALASIGCAATHTTERPRVSPVGIKTIHNRSAACGHFSAESKQDVRADKPAH